MASEPAEPQPATPESAASETAASGPAESEPEVPEAAAPEDASSEGVSSEAASSETVSSEAAESEPPASEDAASEDASSEAASSESSEPASSEPSDAEPASPEPAAAEETPAEEVERPRRRTRVRTRTRSGRAAETSESEPAADAGEQEHGEQSTDEQGADEGRRSRTRTRTRRRSTTAASAASDSPAPEAPAAERQTPGVLMPDAPGPSGVPPVPLVPPVLPTATETSADQVSDIEPASAVGVPSVTFQPPMVVFQPPEPVAAEPSAHEDDERSADADPGDEDAAERSEDDSEERPSRRRRRRGGRGRGRGGRDAADDEQESGTAAEPESDESGDEASDKSGKKGDRSKKDKDKAAKGKEQEPKAEESEQETSEGESGTETGTGAGTTTTTATATGTGTSRRRRRRRRRSGSDADTGVSTDDPPNTVVHVRSARTAESRAAEDEVQSVRGSTRLEAKKQRRREGREQGRRRPPVITEAEFLARRESVERVMVVRQEGERTQIAILEDNVLVEHYVNRATHQSYVGNVYLGKVQNVLPSMEAAFVDIGKGRNAVLYAGEVNWDASGLEGQPRRIESALKSGQSVLVQVTKDPVGHKGARLTSQVSLPGRYLVYVPDGSMTGISRKLPDKERSRLKSILKKVMPNNAGVIVRTAAEGATEEELARDVSRLAAQWENIQKKVKTASAPSLLYGEPDLTIRVVRDIFNEDFSKLVVSGDEAWQTISEYVQYVAPHLADRVERWTGDQDVLSAFRIDEQIAKALDRKVWLPSGGSLVIDRTEAMTVIDVNTGKFTGQGGNLEETVTRNNLEAAEEIVRQLRLRDIGGIIVIDFIDMVLESNRDLVLRRLVECLSRDRTKHQVAEVTSLGLVQMTRKRVGQGLLEAFSETCECCNGRGIHVQLTPVEPKADKGGKEGGRRRKRKGEIERAVEEKLAKQEAAPEGRPEPQAEQRQPEQPSEPKPEPPQAAEEEKPEPTRARRRSGPVKRPAGPPPEIDSDDESPAEAAMEAAEAAGEAADTPPGVLESLDGADPVTSNGVDPGLNGTTPTPQHTPADAE
ncbi:MAG TPA: Rne/Rng family ribonuclease [Spirillospora sp.]